MKHRILVVDDEKNTREGLKWSLEDAGYGVDVAASAEQALELFHQTPTDLVITDLKMPGMDGLDLLRRLRSEDPTLAVIVLTAHGTIETAVEAMQEGATYYLTKPVDLKELRVKCEQALGGRRLALENEQLRSQVEKRYGFGNIIGQSPPMERVFETIRLVAPTRATVLIQGESGTGKELVAHAIHLSSPRAHKPFIAVNCAALTETLLESELFGHEKGAFTGAMRTKPGRFELADGGTILLDEISQTNAEFQVKLLRVLQEQKFERVGGIEPIQVDVRVLASTNQDLKTLVDEGKFREDLYYRLNVVQINLPPLRDRRDDIPLMIDAFMKEIGDANGRPGLTLSPKAIPILRDYQWPGNVRQLRNVIEGMIVMSASKEIQLRNLPDEIRREPPPQGALTLPVGSTFADAERALIRATLADQGDNRAATAKILGIGRKTLYRKMEEYGIR